MASHGIRDKVAIIGMGCTNFGEHWDKSTDDLLIDAAEMTFESAGMSKDDVDAYWLGTAMSGMSGMALARPLLRERFHGTGDAHHPGLMHAHEVLGPPLEQERVAQGDGSLAELLHRDHAVAVKA